MDRSFRSYVWVFGAGTLGGLAAVVALTLLVDPLGAYRSWSLRQFEVYRGGLTSRPAKAELVAHCGYATVLLGSSRVLVGLPVNHPAYGSARVCNLALNGTTLTETSQVLDFTLRHNRLKRVLLGADLHMFSDTRQAKTAFEASRFNPDLDLFEYHGRNLLGSEAVGNAWSMLWQRLGHRSPLPGGRGFAPKLLPRNLSQRDLFRQRIQAALTNPGSDAGFRPSPERLELFRKMVRRCLHEKVELIVFIPPVHALELETIRAAGVWPEFEQWKRDLVRILAEEDATSSVPLWDFTGFAGRVAEEVPSHADGTKRMNWYLEISHFTPALGGLVLERMLTPAATGGEGSDFGVWMTGQNLEVHLARLRAEGRAYAVAHPEEVALVAQLAAATKGRKDAAAVEF